MKIHKDSVNIMKKKILIVIISLLVFFVVTGVFSFIFKDKVIVYLRDTWVDESYKGIKYRIEKKLYGTEEISEYGYKDKIALHFKDKSSMIGELIGVAKDSYYINWKGSETVVYKDMLDHISSPREALKDKVFLSDEQIFSHWPYKNDIVVRLNNEVILDGKISRVDQDKVSLLYAIEDGTIEQDIKRSDIQHLLFKPVENKESVEIEDSLKELFPEMKFYRYGNFTIVTDSYITWVDRCKKTLRKKYSDIYLDFFDIFKDRSPEFQNFVVIFDDYVDFVEYAVADGVPGWAVLGYFSPEDKIVYLFNVLGDRFSDILFEGMVGESGRRIDDIVETVKGVIDDKYHIFIKGQAKTIKNKFWKVYSYYENMFIQSTLSTLRHEFTHELFHNWGLQNIIVSKFEGPDEDLVEKKKDFLETKDCRKKAEILKNLVSQRGREHIDFNIKAANSWLAEGIATYCETEEIGEQNDKWLFIYQQMSKDKPIYPLEFLMAYKIGSFPGVYSTAMIELYAQSWAFVSFLMDKYPKEFMDYQDLLAAEKPEKTEDVKWLEEALNKDIKVIEMEFKEYMDKFEQLEDPFSVHFDKIYNAMNY